MILVISPLLNDTIEQAFAGWSQTTEIALLTVKDMMSEGWQLHSHRFEDSFFVANGKQYADKICLAGDNCSVNQQMAWTLQVPLLRCGSHKLNPCGKALD